MNNDKLFQSFESQKIDSSAFSNIIGGITHCWRQDDNQGNTTEWSDNENGAFGVDADCIDDKI